MKARLSRQQIGRTPEKVIHGGYQFNGFFIHVLPEGALTDILWGL
jgi:hypothetical protein